MSLPRLLDDCFLTDRERLRHDEALAILRERLAPIAAPEAVALDSAGGRILAEAVRAPRAIPAHDNAAVDGYAFAHADYAAHAGRLPLSVRVAAGHAAHAPLTRGTAARIFTGAVMPAGADTVAMQEDCRLDGDTVLVPPGLKPGANRRKAGEDVAAGDAVAEAGARLRPQDIAAIASTGAATARCFAPLRVAVVSTGDEILPPGAAFAPGAVYDSNRPLLSALLSGLPVTRNDLGILPDRADAVRDALIAASRTHHAIIATGGASRGEEDHMAEALDALGRRHMWQIAVKPGRPMSFGRIGDCAVFGLPGNPVAVLVCFALYVRPALLALAGARWREPRRLLMEAAFEIPRKKPDRREFLRGMLVDDGAGIRRVDKFARDGSGLITGLRVSDGLIEIPEETISVARGDPVRFIPFAELGLPAS